MKCLLGRLYLRISCHIYNSPRQEPWRIHTASASGAVKLKLAGQDPRGPCEKESHTRTMKAITNYFETRSFVSKSCRSLAESLVEIRQSREGNGFGAESHAADVG